MDNYIRHLVREYIVKPSIHTAQKIANAVARIEVDDNPPGYLAIGVNYEQGFTFSRLVQTKDPREVYDFLSAESGFDADYPAWDEILLIENGPNCPSLIHLWRERDWA